jgi:hypothetical protein
VYGLGLHFSMRQPVGGWQRIGEHLGIVYVSKIMAKLASIFSLCVYVCMCVCVCVCVCVAGGRSS